MTLSAGIALLNLFLSPAEIERFLPSLRGRFTSFTRWGRRKEPDSKKTTKQPRQSHQQNFYVPPLPSQEKNFEQPPLPPPPPPQQHFYQRRSGYSSGRGVNSKRHRGHFRNVSGSGGQFYSGPPLPPPPPLQMPIPAAFVPMHEPPRRMKMYTHSVPYMAPPPNVYTNFYPFGQPENPFPEYYNLYRSFVVPPPPPPPQQQQPQQPQPMPPPQNSIQEQEPNEKKN